MSNNENRKNIFDEFKKSPVKAMALLYPYVLVIGVGMGLFYLAKINLVERKTVLPTMPDSVAAAPKDLTVIMPSNSSKIDVMAISKKSDSLIALGKTLFTANCIACHGANGKGDGVAAASLNPKPRNFTSDKGWINGPKISGIFKTLSEGISGSAMVAFSAFTPEDKFALAQYIRATFVPNPPQDSKDDLMDLDRTFDLSEGGHNPGQIPIADAMIFVNEEGRIRHEKVVDLVNNISKDAQDEGASIFNRVTRNKIRAITALTSTNEWKNNEKVFVDIIVDESNEAGFNDNVHRLSDSEWDSFYNYMKKVL